jgi:DNA-binding response OmpR family regulator
LLIFDLRFLIARPRTKTRKSEIENRRSKIRFTIHQLPLTVLMAKPVLIVEDDPDIAEGLRYNLEREGLETRVALTGELGLQAALDPKGPPSLVILDLMLPGMSGTELCRRLRREPATRRTPIIMLTARTSEADRVAGLDLGADDYISKPFSVRELMARVKAVLRRVSAPAPTPEIYKFSDVEVNIRSNEVRRDGNIVDLSAKEFALLAYFIAHPVETLSRDRLLDAVWGYENYPTTRTVDTHIVHLRQKLEPNPEEPRFILTVHGSGYKFVG